MTGASLTKWSLAQRIRKKTTRRPSVRLTPRNRSVAPTVKASDPSSTPPWDARPKVIATMIQPIVSSMIAEARITWPTLRRRKSISRTTTATILTEAIESAVPRKSAVTSRWSGRGSIPCGRNSPSAKPQANGMAMPATEVESAARLHLAHQREVGLHAGRAAAASGCRAARPRRASPSARPWPGTARAARRARARRRARVRAAGRRAAGPSRPAGRSAASPRRAGGRSAPAVTIWATRTASDAPSLAPSAASAGKAATARSAVRARIAAGRRLGIRSFAPASGPGKRLRAGFVPAQGATTEHSPPAPLTRSQAAWASVRLGNGPALTR